MYGKFYQLIIAHILTTHTNEYVCVCVCNYNTRCVCDRTHVMCVWRHTMCVCVVCAHAAMHASTRRPFDTNCSISGNL